jgi:hypothetical protein
MSLYRIAVRNGTLIREKRNFLRFWMWKFNRSEEDHLIRLKNRLTSIRQEQAILTAAIPEEQERVKKTKEALLGHDGGTGPPSRDGWTPRREPTRLKKDVKLSGKKKINDKPVKRRPLLELTQPD